MTRLAMPVSVACERDSEAGRRRVDERHQGCRRAHFSVANTLYDRAREWDRSIPQNYICK